MSQVEKAIEIVEREKDGWGSMSSEEADTVLNCLYRLRRILERKSKEKEDEIF